MKLYYNGPIITMEDEQPQAEVLIENEGKIVYVGDKNGITPFITNTMEWVDLKGHTLMPALVDAHSHISDTATLLKTANLQEAKNFSDIVNLLKQFIQNNDISNQPFIVGMGYDHNSLEEHCHPDRRLLDPFFPDIPVMLVHTSIHMGVANGKMLELLNINADTPSPEGGLIARLESSNEPNGYLEETAFNPAYDLILKELALTTADIKRAESLYLQNGILTIQEGSTDYETVRLCRETADQHLLTCDLVAYPAFNFARGIGDSFERNADCIGTYKNHFKVGGYKIIGDGSPQGRTAWMSEPYEGTNDCSYAWVTDEDMQAYTDQAYAEKRQVLCHCNGDACAEQFLTACERSEAKYPNRNLRPVMIHCQTVRDDQLERMAKIGMIASIFVDHVYYWGDIHLKNFGPKRGHHISPTKAAMDYGVDFNFHTDCPVVMPKLFQTVWTAVNRLTKSGIVLGEDQRIDVWNALKAITINAAYLYFEEDEKGSLKVGKKADLIIIDENPLTIDPMRLKDIQVIYCYKNGVLVYEKSER